MQKIYLISILALNIQVNAQTWTPPIGIPSPSFGINETHWIYTNIVNQNQSLTYTIGADGPYTHYVNFTANNCVDGANDGTPLLPRCHIPGSENSPLPAGSVVEVHGQYDYSHTSPTDWHGSGTQQQPIFIRGESDSNMAIITGPFEVIGSSYVIVENIEFADRDGDLSSGDCGSFSITNKNGLAYSSDHIALRHSDIHGNLIYGGIGIGESGNTASVLSDIVIYKNTIHHNGDVNATFDQDVHGIAMGLMGKKMITK